MSGDSSPIRNLAIEDHPLVRGGIAGFVAVQPDMIWVAPRPAVARRSSNSVRIARPRLDWRLLWPGPMVDNAADWIGCVSRSTR
jgi:hypothetical protein